METETIQPFSFEGKSVAIIGGKGKMGQAFAEGLTKVGARIDIFDRDTEVPTNPQSDITLMALSESVTLQILDQLSPDTKHRPLITTSSTNGCIAKRVKAHPQEIPHITPIHTLSGPKMAGAVMIDCTDVGTLSRSIAKEIARIFQMEREEICFSEHDKTIALEQARFHEKVWRWLQSVDDVEMWAKRLPISQRRAAIGEFRVLMRPDISAELMEAFLTRGSNNQILGDEFIFTGESKSPHVVEKTVALRAFLEKLIQEKDPLGNVRSWVKTENERMDQKMIIMQLVGPRSFQEFMRGGMPLENVIFDLCLHVRKTLEGDSSIPKCGIVSFCMEENPLRGEIDLRSKIITVKSEDGTKTIHLKIDTNSCTVEDNSDRSLDDKELETIIRCLSRKIKDII